jgi:replicative DNA helicase
MPTRSHVTPQDPGLLESALGYAHWGWPVFPLHTPAMDGTCSCKHPGCDKVGKHPRTLHGLKDGTTNEDTIRAWWAKWPDANIGIVCGAASGVVVLDIDKRHGGKQSLEELERRHEMLLPTATVRTGGGGNHLFFRHPGGEIRNKAGLDGLPGLDVRGDGGYVVAPSSLHISGKTYEWEADPEEVPMADMPLWLVDLLTARSPPNEKSPEADAGDAISEGRRNATLTSLGGSMRRRGMTESEINAALQRVNAERCKPPLSDAEVRVIAQSVARYPNSGDCADSVDKGSASTAWEPPTPFHEFDLPSFPLNSLPKALRDFVEAKSTATQTPPDMTGLLALSVSAAALAKRVTIEADNGWTEPVNLYTVTTLDPGNRKSAVFSATVAPLEEFEQEECLRMAPEVQVAMTRYKIAEEALRNAERAAAKADPKEREALSLAAEQMAREFSATKVPAMPRFIADDTTPERLSSLLHEQGGRMAVMSPEGGVFDLMSGRYSANGAPNFEVYLKAHAGDDLRVDRVGRPSEHVKAPALVLGLTIQQEVLRGLVNKTTLRGRGLLARFLYSMPKSLVGHRKSRPPIVPEHILSGYHRLIRTMLELPCTTDEAGDPIAYLLQLDDAARQRIHRFQDWLEPQLGPDGDLGSLADWGAKLAGAAVRISGILHVAKKVSASAPWQTLIDFATMEEAICIAKYLIPHAKAAHALMGADPAVEDAKRLLRWIEKGGRNGFTKRDAFGGMKGHFRKVSAMEPALVLLQDHNYIRERHCAERVGPGRPSSPSYDVNPLWLPQNPHNPQNYLASANSVDIADSVDPDTASAPFPTRAATADEVGEAEMLVVGGFE